MTHGAIAALEREGRCKACRQPGLRPIYDLGSMPPVNAFLRPDEVPSERGLPVELVWCADCSLVQLAHTVPPSELFREYLHLSSASTTNRAHLEAVAATLVERLGLGPDARVLEVGCNDGVLLEALAGATPHVVGVDPARNLAPLCAARGVPVVSAFLQAPLARQLRAERGPFDAVVALNVVAHTPDIVGLLRSVELLLADDGVFVMEAVYVRDTILRGQFDTVYHEHVYQLSLGSLQGVMQRAGLRVTDVEHVDTQGGSLRVFARRQATAPPPSAAVQALLAEEAEAGLARADTYAELGRRYRAWRQQLRSLLQATRADTGVIAGVGAPARGIVILNACGIDARLLDYVIDDTPLKQDRLCPGVHVPVTGWDALIRRPASAFLLLSWNYRDVLLERLRAHGQTGPVIVPFPTLQTVQL